MYVCGCVHDECDRALLFQLNSRYKGLDAVREGQIEARERLLTEMETKARHECPFIEHYLTAFNDGALPQGTSGIS